MSKIHKIRQAIKEHKELLYKELGYSEDLQNKDVIERHKSNLKKVELMLREEWKRLRIQK